MNRTEHMDRCPKPRVVSCALALLALLALPALAGDRVYKWTDANGVVHYTNKRPASLAGVSTLDFPCYASDPRCRSVDWESVALNTAAFAQPIRDAAGRHAVDESLIRAVIHAESAYRPDALSPKGAQGLMQLMPATAAELAVPDAFDPAANIDGGSRYLSGLLKTFDGNIELATAAYNAGPEAVRRHGGVPPYEETREYVRRVQILYRRYRGAGG